MAGKGSAPGERRGGRSAGTPNKATEERRIIEQYQEQAAKLSKAVGKDVAARKLAKEILEDFMILLTGAAARYQPRFDSKGKPQAGYDEAKFFRYSELAIDCADRLAPYQSPTFRAIVVAPAPDNRGRMVTRFTFAIFATNLLPGEGANDTELVTLPAAKAG